jgi:hypothetical protein
MAIHHDINHKAIPRPTEKQSQKREEIDMEFYGTSAMIHKNWRKANQEQRQVVTRFSIHGFHHKLCKNKKFHKPTADCEYGLFNKKNVNDTI